MKGKCYSVNGEDFKCLEDVMAELCDSHELGESVEIYAGDYSPQEHSEFVSGARVIEDIQNSAFGDFGEYAGTYLDDIDLEKAKELEALIIGWLDKNAKRPEFCSVQNVEKITVVVEE